VRIDTQKPDNWKAGNDGAGLLAPLTVFTLKELPERRTEQVQSATQVRR